MNGAALPTRPLWPFGIVAALVTIPIVWAVLVVVLTVTSRLSEWPDAGSRSAVLYFIAAVSLIPLVLSLLDFAAARRAVVDIKGIKLDFSRLEETERLGLRETFRLPHNIGVPGLIVSDTRPMQIVAVLLDATKNEIVQIDLDTGHAWWTTRLLALSAGAVRAGAPRVFVFVGRKENVPGTFLGWADARNVLRVLLDSNEHYRVAYNRAQAIALQLVAFGELEVRPPGMVLHHEVSRYADAPEYRELGAAVAEQVFMDQLAGWHTYPAGSPVPVSLSLEQPPDHLTLGRFADLFEPYLYRDAIDLAWPNERQVAALLDSRAPYVALVRGGRYEGLLERTIVERLIIRQLVLGPDSRTK
jgi:hypothetical protein